jgi:hypothetical protein
MFEALQNFICCTFGFFVPRATLRIYVKNLENLVCSDLSRIVRQNDEKFIISRLVSNQLVNNKEEAMILFLFSFNNQHKQQWQKKVDIQEVFVVLGNYAVSLHWSSTPPILALHAMKSCTHCALERSLLMVMGGIKSVSSAVSAITKLSW